MKTSASTPRTSRKTTTTTLKASAAEKQEKPKKARAPRSTTTRRKTAPATATAELARVRMPTVDELNHRAYEIYLRRNGHGDALSDWLQAERELMSQAG